MLYAGVLQSYLPSTHHLVYLFFVEQGEGRGVLLRNIGNRLPQIEEAQHLPLARYQSPSYLGHLGAAIVVGGLPVTVSLWGPDCY